jgi:hypothetical protein
MPPWYVNFSHPRDQDFFFPTAMLHDFNNKEGVKTRQLPYKNANDFNPTRAKCLNNKSLTKQTMTKVKRSFSFISFWAPRPDFIIT